MAAKSDLVRKIIITKQDETAQPKKKELSAERKSDFDFIVRQSYNVYRINPKEVTKENKKRLVSDARSVAMKIIKDEFERRKQKITLQEICDYFEMSNHTTVLHAIRKIDNLIETDKPTRYQYNKIRIRIITQYENKRHKA